MENTGKLSPFMRQCFVTASVGFNIISYGFAVGFPAVLLPQLRDNGSPVVLSREQESWIAAVLPLSQLTGNLITPPIMDRLGRKAAHYILTIIFLIGWYITIFATNFETLIVSRLCVGIASGLLTTLRSVLIGEYTSPRKRGAFLTTVSLAQAFGIFLVHLLGSLFSWQRTALISVFFPFVSLIMVIYTPESPSWLLARGKYDECRKVFFWLRGNKEEAELEDMIECRLAYERAAIGEQRGDGWLKNLLTIISKREFYKPIALMIHSNAILHLSGASTMAAYSTIIIGLIAGTEANAHFWMVFLDAQRIISNVLAIYIIGKVNRRTMVFGTGALSVLSHLVIALYVYARHRGWSYEAVWLPALLINVKFFAVAVGTVPMPQVIGGEIFPLDYRSTGGTVSLIAAGGIMFVILLIFPNLIDTMGLHGTYTLFAFLILANLIVMFFWLPETKDKTLQQIEDELRGRPLKLDEIEARESLKSNAIEMYKRKLSHSSTSNN